MGRPVTDFDLWVMDCYYESPIFSDDSQRYSIEIMEDALERYFSNELWYEHGRFAVELVLVA
jgi:hypothetical protein